ncbi:MAG: ATP-dependent acyl-CoA ligase [Chloroflexota bacterium]|nr:ATP-dependent acyl-CoA ligase [Chloroflexota bacterium]
MPVEVKDPELIRLMNEMSGKAMQAMLNIGMENATVGRLVKMKAEKNGDKVFLFFEDEQVTYKQMDDRSDRVANALSQMGVKKGDKVAIMLPNCPEYYYCWWGVSKIGAIFVPINVSLRGDGLTYILNHSEANTIFLSHEYIGHYRFIESDLTGIARLILETRYALNSFKLPSDAVPLEELLTATPTPPEVDISPMDTMEIIYSSGTTGPPKGVQQQHMGSVFAGVLPSMMGLSEGDIMYTCLPLFHGNAQMLTTMPALLGDLQVAMSKKFSASRFWDEIRKFNATEFNYIGGIPTILYNQDPKPNDADNPVRYAFGAACPKDVWEPFEKRFGLEIVEGYGAVEAGAVTINLPLSTGWKRKVPSMGVPFSAVNEIRVVDDNENDCPPNVTGEMLGRFTMQTNRSVEYYKMEEETSEVTRGGWFHTGDLVYYDEDGYLYFVDRKKDYIRRRGENISSWEIESVVNKHPSVLECAAFGVKSDLGEDEVKVSIQLHPGMKLEPEELMAWCESRMGYYMIPRYVEIVDELPKTETHRIEKYKLKAAGVTEQTWDREKAGYKIKRS